MKNICLFLLFNMIFCAEAFSQNLDSFPNNDVVILNPDSFFTFKLTDPEGNIRYSNCDTAVFISMYAQNDIQEEKVRLLIPKEFTLTAEDSLVQKKYNFEYAFFDRIYPFSPDNNYCDKPELYNTQIFDYWKTKYGSSWQQEIRNDIYGYDLIQD